MEVLRMRSKTVVIFVILSSFLLLTFACSKKQTVKPEPTPPPAEEVKKDIPPVVEEPVKEPPVKQEPMPVLEDVYFAFDKYNLTDESKRTLERNADEMKSSPSSKITIEGHCDERGTVEYNIALGEKRAKAAMSYLVTLGINGSRIEVISYGKSRPFDPGHNEDAWAKNRRAHFVIK
jgi:peptidoglycan-associated lipoprotein